MLCMEYEWDDDKEAANIRDHDGVTFTDAIPAIEDAFAVEELDESHSDDEKRFNVIGMSVERILFVVITMRGEDSTRIISARKAEPKERAIYEQQFEEE